MGVGGKGERGNEEDSCRCHNVLPRVIYFVFNF